MNQILHFVLMLLPIISMILSYVVINYFKFNEKLKITIFILVFIIMSIVSLILQINHIFCSLDNINIDFVTYLFLTIIYILFLLSGAIKKFEKILLKILSIKFWIILIFKIYYFIFIYKIYTNIIVYCFNDIDINNSFEKYMSKYIVIASLIFIVDIIMKYIYKHLQNITEDANKVNLNYKIYCIFKTILEIVNCNDIAFILSLNGLVLAFSNTFTDNKDLNKWPIGLLIFTITLTIYSDKKRYYEYFVE